jgi:ABC-type dipeptide/oligopeptide/nickel transport system permease component
MAGLIVRRSVGAAVTFVVSTVVVFIVAFALPGDPARAVAGRRSSEDTLAAIRSRYHLDEPLPVQYWRWLSDVLHGDLGESYVSRRPVADIMRDALPTTVTLLVLTLAIEVSLGLLIGTVAGGRRGRGFDAAVLVGCTLALAVPAFVVGIIGQDLLGVRWGLLPVSGTSHGLRSYVLPAITLALPGLAVAIRLTRSETLANRTAPHVRTATSKGVGAGRVTRRHVVRNSLGPFVVFLGLEIGVLAGGAVVVERVFNLPGVGRAIALAIGQHDNALILGFTMVLIAVYLVIDLVVDVAAMVLDPRLRHAQP